MVDQLVSFADEVTRVAREVGTEGTPRRPGRGRGRLRHVEGADREREPHGDEPDRPGARHRRGRDRGRHGDLSQKITVDARGEILELKNTINTMVDQLSASPTRSRASRARSVPRARSAARPRSRASPARGGSDRHVNFMAGNLTEQVRNIAEVTTAVANGDLSKKITVDAAVRSLELKNTINTMVDQLGVVRGRGDPRRARGGHRG